MMITTAAAALMEVMNIGIWEELSASKPTLHIRFMLYGTGFASAKSDVAPPPC